MEQFIFRNEISTIKKITLTSNEAVKQAVLAGLGYSIMPVIGLKNELHNDQLQIIPMKGLPITTDWNLIWLKQKQFSPAASAYLDYLRDEKDHIISDKFSWFKKY